MSYLLAQADAVRLPLPDRSVDLVFGSPPYCDARTYGIGAQRGCAEWVDWMLRVTTEALRVSRGAVLWVAAGVTRDRTYWPACEGLMWEWWKRNAPSGVYEDGIELPGCAGSAYRPCYWKRNGIPGSGGNDWFRHDTEHVMCFKNPGGLSWSENTAMGHVPKFAPGGRLAYRTTDGTRISNCGVSRRQNGKRRDAEPSQAAMRVHTKRTKGTNHESGKLEEQLYGPPDLSNPGNMVRVSVGGGHLGHTLAHENEAPFPEALAEWFLRSLCKPGGTVLDPFSGSGTTVAVAERLGRHGIGLDLRRSQADIATQRIEHPHQPVVKKGREEYHPLFVETS